MIYLKKYNEYRCIIYVYFFIFYFLIYYCITVPETISQIKNIDLNNISEVKKIVFIIIIVIINILYIASTIFLVNKYQLINKHKATLLPIAITGIILFIDILVISRSKYLQIISQSKITKYIFLIISYLFFIIFFIFFIYNINDGFAIEFYISLIILGIFLLDNIFKSAVNMNKIYYLLKNNNYSELSVNCFSQNTVENYNDKKNLNQSDSLKTIGDIPVAFYNNYIDEYQELILSDFYYPGSYYSYLPDSPLNGTPSLQALQTAISTFKCRFIHLDIFSDSTDEYDPNANPVVRCENMSTNAVPLNFEETLGVINKWAWTNNEISYPFFLYLNFNFNKDNQSIYFKIYNSLIKFFSQYFIDKKYSFSGRNSSFSISHAKMKESLGKIIIITNIYPTKSILDELINECNNSLSNNFKLCEYKEDYVKYDGIGLSQDNNKTTLITNSKTNINFYYTVPNIKYKNNSQPKAGLYNPSFQDCAQYGIQGTLMYIFIPDDNLNKWNLFFKNKNNLNPVLKDESLRNIIKNKNEIKEQDPIIGLQSPQKYCVIPGLIDTQKSNLSTGVANSSC